MRETESDKRTSALYLLFKKKLHRGLFSQRDKLFHSFQLCSVQQIKSPACLNIVVKTDNLQCLRIGILQDVVAGMLCITERSKDCSRSESSK